MSPTLTLNAPVAPVAPIAPAPVRSRDLAAEYTACFDWVNPRPLKRHIHKDLARIDQQGGALPDGADGAQRQAAAFQVQRQVKSALADYCTRPAYLAALRPGAARIDLHGQPGTESELWFSSGRSPVSRQFGRFSLKNQARLRQKRTKKRISRLMYDFWNSRNKRFSIRKNK